MTIRKRFGAAIASSVLIAGGILAFAEDKKASGEQERKVKESEVPAAALESLKKLASGAAFTEFAEEIEHGHTFYEGSWRAADGGVDALVTETGAVVELEEKIPANKVPAAVQAAAEKAAGKGAKVSFERKTLYLYEIHFKKNGKGQEAIFTADARPYHEGGQQPNNAEDKDEDEDK